MAYNGWKNYETWNVALWIDNERGSYDEAREMARQAWERATTENGLTRKKIAVVRLAEQVREWVNGMNPLAGQASMFTDLLNAALSEVDWHEIAESWISEVMDEESQEVETLQEGSRQ